MPRAFSKNTLLKELGITQLEEKQAKKYYRAANRALSFTMICI
jgi:hypothetical protein